MVKTSAQILFDFMQAKKRAGELEDIAEDMRRLAKRDMENTIGSLAVAWKGENARQYMGKAEKLRQEIEQTATELNGIAATIRRIASLVYEAEMAALQVAQQRDV